MSTFTFSPIQITNWDSQNVQKLNSWLYRLLENLQYALDNVGTENMSNELIQELNRVEPILREIEELYRKIGSLSSKSITTDNLSAKVADLGYLSAEEAEITYATIEKLKTVEGQIETLSSKSITTDNLSAKVADLGYLSADIAEIKYAKVDFSNVGTQVVSSSMIIDGAVTNEKVGNLSANKITSGTIDASKIRVTNLNADNLTVGTINGKLIGSGTVDLDKLSEEVPTKEYLDSVQENLQGQIDGAIETFTKTEIPTLNNEPASLWTDNETKKKHIGDICYVVNPTSSADGYCYRFANLGTEANPEYSWDLIKDSDVTKALQDIIDINGEITGIKQFDNEISSWKTDTEEELSSIKMRTTTLETDMGNKVETSVFSSLKQTVDSNTASITSLSNTVSKKADSSTVTTLSNTVNTVKQTADKNTSSISSLQNTVSTKADSSTVTKIESRTSTLEQDLSGFKTTVSSTYVTKTEFNNIEVGGRNLIRNSAFLNGESYWNFNTGVTIDTERTFNGHSTVKDEQSGLTTSSWKGAQVCNLPNYPTTILAGETYTVSCWYYIEDASLLDSIFALEVKGMKSGATSTSSIGVVAYNAQTCVVGEWVKIHKTFTATTDYEECYVLAWVQQNGTVWFADFKLEKGNKPTDWTPAPEDTDSEISSVSTIATQTAEKFEWLVSSGTSATNFTLTDRMATLIADTISLNGDVKVSGDMIVDGSITADKIDVEDLFAQNITAKNMTLTENSQIGSMHIDMFTDGHSRLYDGDFTIGYDGINIPGLLQITSPEGLSYLITSNDGGFRISSDSSLDNFVGITEQGVSAWVDGKIKWRLDESGLTIGKCFYKGSGITSIETNDDGEIIGSFLTGFDSVNNRFYYLQTADVDLAIEAPIIKLSDPYKEHINVTGNTIQATEWSYGNDEPITLYLNSEGGNVSIDNLISQDKLGMHSHMRFDNNLCIYGTNTSGALRSNFQPVNSNNNCVIGYGSYSASEGSTNLYGNYIELTTKNPMHSNRPLKTLWSGVYFMGASQVATLAEKISEQLNGIVLVWSYYSSGAQDYFWNCIFVPKGFVSAHPGGGIAMFLASGNAGYKYVYVNDTTVTGNSNNVSSMTINGVTVHPENYVLRYIYGV